MLRGGCNLFRKEIGFTCSIRYGSGICNTYINGWSVSLGIADGQLRKARKEIYSHSFYSKYIDCTIIYHVFIVCLLEGCNGFTDKVCMAKCKENAFQSFNISVDNIYKIHFSPLAQYTGKTFIYCLTFVHFLIVFSYVLISSLFCKLTLIVKQQITKEAYSCICFKLYWRGSSFTFLHVCQNKAGIQLMFNLISCSPSVLIVP